MEQQEFTIHFSYVDYCGSVQITVPKNTTMDEVLYNNEQFRQQKEQQLQECGLSTLMKAQLVPPLSSSSHPSPTVSQFCKFGGQILYSPIVDEDCLHVQQQIQEDDIRDLIESMSTKTTKTTTTKGNAKKKDVEELRQNVLKLSIAIRKRDETIRERDETIRERDETIRRRDADLDSLQETIRRCDADINRRVARANKVYMRGFLAQIQTKIVQQSGQNPDQWNEFLLWAKDHLDLFPPLTAMDLDKTAFGEGTLQHQGNVAAHSELQATEIADYFMTKQGAERESFARLFFYLYDTQLESFFDDEI